MFAASLTVADDDQPTPPVDAQQMIKVNRRDRKQRASLVTSRADHLIEPPLEYDLGMEVQAVTGGAIHLLSQRVGEQTHWHRVLLDRKRFRFGRLIPRVPRGLRRRPGGHAIQECSEIVAPIAGGRGEREHGLFQFLEPVRRGVNELAVIDVKFAAVLLARPAHATAEQFPQAWELVPNRVAGHLERAASDHQRPKQRSIPGFVNP